MKETLTNGCFHNIAGFQAYLSVSMDVWGLDRYFVINHEYEC